MATVPLSGTHIRVMSNVPFNNDYKNTRWFANQAAQTNYFLSKPVIYNDDERNFQRIEGRTYLSVKKSIDELWGANYMMFKNAQYNNKWFYGFITKLEYVQRNNTLIHFEIDVFQTWKFEMNFKPSYVVREHRPLWNSDGTPVINTVDEGLNYGRDYETMGSLPIRPDGYKWMVIVSKESISPDTDAITSSVIGTPQPLHYYVVPYKDDDSVPMAYIVKDQVTIRLTEPTKVLETIFVADSAVNNIVSIYVTDYIGLSYSFAKDAGVDVVTFPDNGDIISHVGIRKDGTVSGGLLEVQHVDHFRDRTIDVTTDKYTLPNSANIKTAESKLMMYPYTVLVLDDFKGNRQEYKLEYINSKQLDLLWKGSLGSSNFNSIVVKDYNRGNSQDSFISETSNEDALINNSASDVPILTSMLSAYLQGNRNSIQNSQSQIKFNGMMGVIGNGIGAVSSAVTKNPAGVASSVTGIAQGVGNTVYQLQGIQAKMADIDNTPAQIQKMGSNTAYNYGNDYNGVYVMIKQIKPEYKKILTDFFNMFGYKTNEVKTPNFNTRKSWNYVQTSACNITGNFNNEDLQDLKNVFDNGITFWHTDDVGNYELDNGVK